MRIISSLNCVYYWVPGHFALYAAYVREPDPEDVIW